MVSLQFEIEVDDKYYDEIIEQVHKLVTSFYGIVREVN